MTVFNDKGSTHHHRWVEPFYYLIIDNFQLAHQQVIQHKLQLL